MSRSFAKRVPLLMSLMVTAAVFVPAIGHAQISFLNDWTAGPFGVSLSYPTGAAVAPDGTVYVADNTLAQVVIYSPTGAVETWLGGGDNFRVATNASGSTIYVSDLQDNELTVYTPKGGFFIVTFLGRGGIGNGQFQGPAGVAISSSGTLYVADDGNNRIEAFNADNTFQSSFNDNGQLSGPVGVAVGANNLSLRRRHG